MQKLAADYWNQFWNAHPDVDLEKVSKILSSAPVVPKFDPHITADELRRALRTLDPNKARGPDAWSNYELKSMPADCEERFLQLLSGLTDTPKWPAPLSISTVAMLAKTDNALDLSQTRPITVLSVARKFLLNILPWLPSGVQGNIPGASSKWIGVHIQTLAEHALISGRPFHLASVDLVNAYNLLHRDVLALCNDRFETPDPVWHSYQSFLGSVRRHFRIQGSLSPAVTSVTGCPEGDALAVYQMTQINWLATLHIDWEQRNTRDTVFVNYVDNWLLHSYFHNSLESSLRSLLGLANVAGYRVPTRHG